MKRLVKALISIIFLIFLYSSAFADTHYLATDGTDAGTCGVGNACLTLDYVFDEMAGGDTLEIADGTYTGSGNSIMNITGTVRTPPSGTAENYTIIKAENEGQVTFDGEGVRFMFYMSHGDLSYVEFHGIKWVHPDYNTSGGAVHIASDGSTDHLKFYRCGARVGPTSETGKNAWAIESVRYGLWQECYAWGMPRYGWKFAATSASTGARYNICRRCVVRLDNVYGNGIPVSGFQSYDSPDLELQNCIVIDGDTSEWSTWSYSGSAFNHRSSGGSGYYYAENNYFRGCISLNNLGWTHGSHDSYEYYAGSQAVSFTGYNPNHITNCVFWDAMNGIRGGGGSGATISNVTIKIGSDPSYVSGHTGIYGSLGINMTDWSIKNSIVIGGDKYSMRGSFTDDYNCVYNSKCVDAGTQNFEYYGAAEGNNTYCYENSNRINPEDGSALNGNGTTALKYICQVESGSDCDGTGDGGVDRGANIIYKYGADNTLWGDANYNTLTANPLWPFPYEDQIRTDMRVYDPIGGPSGTRGFCTNGETLTRYIWNYLGNGGYPRESMTLGIKVD